MSESQLQEPVDAALAYERLFVTGLFAQWAPLVVGEARVRPGQRVLDVACGTGVLAREAASHAGASGHVVGLDIAPGMLAVARRSASAIEWRQGTADALPFPDQAFDAVVSQFGLMFFPDRRRSLREMLRVMVAGGRLAVAVWDSLEHIPAFADEVALLERVAGPRAADALRAPFVLGEKSGLLQLAQDAGIASVEVRTHQGTARFPSIRSLVEADLRGWLPVMGVSLEEEKIKQVLAEADKALGAHADDQGHAVFQVTAHIISGTKP